MTTSGLVFGKGLANVEAGSAARERQAQRSALWAAYGDALGWISELTDARGLKRRTGGAALEGPVAWSRRIGGRGGVTVSLPRGCYSDDSQLRLATSRAIRADGFDVEAFAKVELPIWLGYALGAGKGTSAAASNLTKSRAAWFANRFKGWTQSGGNGAAMRIQPHIWAARSPQDAATFLPDVVRNTICTHSHPIGLLGAVLHALALAFAVVKGRPPAPDDFLAITREAARLPEVMAGDVEVASYWRTAFERESGDFEQAWARAIAESQEAIAAVGNGATETAGEQYAQVVARLGLTEAQRRGSGMLTAVAAVAATWLKTPPEEAIRIVANAIGTDTDTIATMAGAILGVVADHDPPVEVLDADLFRSEAARLTAIAFDKETSNHRYPDLVKWTPPRGRADTLVRTPDGALRVVGLGPAKPFGEEMSSSTRGFAWRWVRVAFGQTLLVKHRVPLPGTEELHSSSKRRGESRKVPEGKSISEPEDMLSLVDADRFELARELSTGKGGGPSLPKEDDDGTSRPSDPAHPNPLTTAPAVAGTKDSRPKYHERDLRNVLRYLEEHIDDDLCVGRALRRVVEKGTPPQAMEFLAAYYRLVNR